MASRWLRREAAAVCTSIDSSNPCLSDRTIPDSLLSYVCAHQQHLTSFRALFWDSSVHLSASLATLPNLSCLRLQPSNPRATFLHLQRMTSLRDLELRFDPRQAMEFSRSSALPSHGLASRLTALELRTTRSIEFMQFEQGHPIGQLYCLRKLKLPRGAHLDPDLLAEWLELQHLELQDVMMGPKYGIGKAEEALLAQLQQQTQVVGTDNAQEPGRGQHGSRRMPAFPGRCLCCLVLTKCTLAWSTAHQLSWVLCGCNHLLGGHVRWCPDVLLLPALCCFAVMHTHTPHS